MCGEIAYIDNAHVVGSALGVGDPLAVRRERDSVESAIRAGEDNFLGLCGRIHLDKAVLTV